MEKISYLGPEGSYSQLAAKKMCPEAALMPCQSFPQVFSSLTSGLSDGAVVPIENTLNGGVLQNIDLLQETEGICAVGECTIKIDHRLAMFEGADESGIKFIYSHSQALEQCAKYLYAKFPTAQLVPTPSTAASLEKIRTKSDAGIVGAHTKKQGLVLSENNISDGNNNFTHFLLLKRGEADKNTHSNKIYFSVTCANRSGALLLLLNRVSQYGLNMTKIESRPVKNLPDEYRFFIEIEGDYSSENVKTALEDIKNAANSFKLLGCY